MAGKGSGGRGDQTRALILDRALAVFADVGYRAASVREIAARCGLSHPALIYHFPTKADLLMAVLRRRDTPDAPGGGMDDLHGREVLDHLVDTARLNSAVPGIVELYATLSGEATSASHPAHRYFQDRYAGLLSQVSRAYRELESSGELRAGVDPDLAARRLIAVMDGLQVQWLLDPTVDMATGIAAQIAEGVVAPA